MNNKAKPGRLEGDRASEPNRRLFVCMSKIAVPGGDSKDFWHRRNSYEMLTELAEVSPEEYGFLTILRDLMFVRGGAIADDVRIARQFLGLNSRGWERLRERLIGLGKIYPNGDTLRSRLVDDTLDQTREVRRKFAQSLPKVYPNIPAKPLK